jgi:hypothetical protein
MEEEMQPLTTLKHGTRVQIRHTDLDGCEQWEGGKILKRIPKAWGDLPEDMRADWARVRFDAGGALTLHRSHFRVTDNRA